MSVPTFPTTPSVVTVSSRCVAEGRRERNSILNSPKIRAVLERAVAKGVSADEVGKVFGEAMTKALHDGAELVAGQLNTDMPAMLADHAAIRGGFEERLYERWREALNLYEAVTTCCLEAGEQVHDEIADAESDHPLKTQALTLLHARGCLIASEIGALLRSGHAVGAQGRWRTLHEIAVIADGDEELANRFSLHRYVDRWKEARVYQQYCEALGYEQYTNEEMTEFQRVSDGIVAQYEPGYADDWGWSKPLFVSPKHRPTFYDLERLARLDHNMPWTKLSHHAVHSGSSGTVDIIDLHGQGGRFMLAGPSDAGLADPGQLSLIALHQVTCSFILNAPTESTYEDLLVLKTISLLIDQASDAFFQGHLKGEDADGIEGNEAEGSPDLEPGSRGSAVPTDPTRP